MNKKKIILLSIGIIILGFIGYGAYLIVITRPNSPADTAVFQDEDFSLQINYCRPYKKDRLIFGTVADGALVPYEVYWRTGANDATEIEFSKDIDLAGRTLKAGRYRLYTIPGPGQWAIVFNSELGAWGAQEPDYSKDVLSIRSPAIKSDQYHEQFTIEIRKDGEQAGAILLSWDHTTVPVRFGY